MYDTKITLPDYTRIKIKLVEEKLYDIQYKGIKKMSRMVEGWPPLSYKELFSLSNNN